MARNAAGQARYTELRYCSVAVCRHVIESCSHKIRAAGHCGRYAITGGRAGNPAWFLM